MQGNDYVADYRREMEKPLEEIKEDIFFRADNFRDEAWYGDFLLFTRIGVCQPSEEHIMQVRKALKIMGYTTHTTSREGQTYIVPGEERQTSQVPSKSHKQRDLER